MAVMLSFPLKLSKYAKNLMLQTVMYNIFRRTIKPLMTAIPT